MNDKSPSPETIESHELVDRLPHSELETVPRSNVAMVIKDPILQMIAEASVNPNVDMDKFDRLMAWKDREEEKLAEKKFNAAMSRCQKAIVPIAVDMENTHTSSWYASYAALDRVVRPVYTKHGFALSFDTGDHDDPLMLLVLCLVTHKDGFSRQYKVLMPADGKGAKGGDVMSKTHAAGSAMYYGQRYLLRLIFNLAIHKDDDGNAAGAIPVQLINESQVANLNLLLEEVNGNPVAFCKWLTTCKVRLGLIENISVKFYPEVVRELERKRGAV